MENEYTASCQYIVLQSFWLPFEIVPFDLFTIYRRASATSASTPTLKTHDGHLTDSDHIPYISEAFSCLKGTKRPIYSDSVPRQ